MRPDSSKTRELEDRCSAFTLVEVVFAIAIIALVFTGIITAYTHATRRAEWSGYSLAAQALAVQQLEVARSAVWDPGAGKNELTNLNLLSWQWYWTNATQTGVGYGYTTNILDTPISRTNYIRATNYVTVRLLYLNNSVTPPVQIQMIKVNTVWPFTKGQATRYFTNTAASYFAPDNRDPNSI